MLALLCPSPTLSSGPQPLPSLGAQLMAEHTVQLTEQPDDDARLDRRLRRAGPPVQRATAFSAFSNPPPHSPSIFGRPQMAAPAASALVLVLLRRPVSIEHGLANARMAGFSFPRPWSWRSRQKSCVHGNSESPASDWPILGSSNGIRNRTLQRPNSAGVPAGDDDDAS
ncbi:hypothetical protein P154DRAFT_578491 [Amniculicola lignicola CBS 123094]|uniref:Uncharacterized protein n=1 Tax=Amniculicola lignicola CBS 123094 TaxID=1392246 RepID=A0A6A5WCU1_9PLEO|nr:hypothetical protein P154DRAFT_578491 [Amniculicola lignicola CBS 123094]